MPGAKKEKDPNMPKRPLTPYFAFSADERPKVRAEHPDWKMIENAKEMARRWAEIGDDRKAEYQKKCDAERTEYIKAMAKYRTERSRTNVA